MIIDMNRYNGGGGSGSGVTPEQVQQQIDSALTPYWESGETKDYVDSAVSGISLDGYYTSAQTDAAIAQAVSGLATEQYVQDALSGVSLEGYWNSAETQDAISAATAGKADKQNVQNNLDNTWFPSWNSQGIIIGTAKRAYDSVSYINGKKKVFIDTNGNGSFGSIYAPDAPGTAGDILVSTGNGAPAWTNDNKVSSTSVSTIWKGTQAEYDAITTKDPNTFYIIVSN